MFGWVLGLRFVHFDTVFENFSLCTSYGPINSFLTSFDGALPILLLGVDESEAVWGRRGVLEEERGEIEAGIGGELRNYGNCLFLGKVEEIGGDFLFFIIIFFLR